MISWYSIILIVVAVLLTMLVIRLSEVSTRMQTLENVTTRIIADNAAMSLQTPEFVTHKELHAIMRHASPSYFTIGR
jgi:uncharacterized membrane-anchored protein YhcB (DUF1043 family)